MIELLFPAFRSSVSYPAKYGAYFAAIFTDSIMLTALALPVPAMSKAVPWSTEARSIGMLFVMAMVRSK